MKVTHSEFVEHQSDESLVRLTLAGNHDAFGAIVNRYQAPICGLAFSSCGDLSRSEDLGQEIFITAFKNLRTLNDFKKFKAWLYGIARNVIRNGWRASARNPITGSVPLADEHAQTVATNPGTEAISKEEAAILWSVLSSLPEIYRQPMAMYYQENQAIQKVAEVLGISEELTRQRLSRGRALLNERIEQVLHEGLRRLKPSDGFALAVLAALPVVAAATTAQGAVMGVAAMKSAPAKAGWLGGLKAMGIFAGMLAIPAGVGSLFGILIGRDTRGHNAQRKSAAKFWRFFGWGLLLLLLAPLTLTLSCAGFLHGASKDHFLKVMTFWLGLSYPFVPLALCFWVWQRNKTDSGALAGEPAATAISSALPEVRRASIYRRLALFATLGALGLIIFCYRDMHHHLRFLQPEDLRQFIAKANPATITITETESHYRSLFKTYPETNRRFFIKDTSSGKLIEYCATADASTESLLVAKGITCPLYFEGRDYEVLGTPGRMLPFLGAFILGLAGIFVLKTRRAEKAERPTQNL